jgi:ABC-2 type transport system permease protein
VRATGEPRTGQWPVMLRAEWTKLRTDPGTVRLLLALVGLTVAVSAVVLFGSGCVAGGCVTDPARLSLTGLLVGQAVAVVLAATVIGGEYSTGMIRTTLAAMPHRTGVLAAKAAVVSGAVAVAGAVAVLGSLGAGALILGAKGYPVPSLADGPTLRAVVGSVLYLVLVGLLGLGLATAFRNAVTAVGVVLGLLYLLPIVTRVVVDPVWQRRLEEISLFTAGLSVQTTKDVAAQPGGPWHGLGVAAVWAAVALAAGWLVLRGRDA